MHGNGIRPLRKGFRQTISIVVVKLPKFRAPSGAFFFKVESRLQEHDDQYQGRGDADEHRADGHKTSDDDL